MGSFTTTNPTSTTQVAADLQTYFSKALLKQAKYKVVLDQFGYTENIPSNSSKTISFTQYSDLTPLTAANLNGSEGVAPNDTALTTTAITAVVDQLGAFVTLTDLAKLTPKHPVMQKTIELLGVQGARSYDNLIFNAISAGTGVFYAGGVASRATLTSTSYLTFQDVLKGVVNLRKNGASEFDDGNFVLVVTPQVEGDLLQDTNLQNVAYRQQPNSHNNELYKGAIMTFGGVTIVRSNQLAANVVPNTGVGGTLTAHLCFLFGQNAYAVTNLQNMQTYTQQPGGIADPLEQRMTVGWKAAFKAVILNNNFFYRFESVSRF
jgi:N4-gp56 family major capsid protein